MRYILRQQIRRCATSLLFAVVSCADPSPTSLPRTLDPSALSASRATVSVLGLVVTITDADASGNPYRIRSDGQGSYTNGTQGVQAILDQYGTFAFNTFTSGKVAVRWVTYDFSSPVDPTNTYRPNPSNSINYHFSTGNASAVPFVPIQNLGVNGNPTTECIYMGNGFGNSTTVWRVSFHKGLEDVPSSPTAYAVVTRSSVSPARWTIAPVGACSPNSNVASLRSGDGSVLYGYYNLPFYFTLAAQ